MKGHKISALGLNFPDVALCGYLPKRFPIVCELCDSGVHEMKLTGVWRIIGGAKGKRFAETRDRRFHRKGLAR